MLDNPEFIFEWDLDKARRNLRVHRISFEEASTVFSDLLSVTIPDPLHSSKDDRLIIMGSSYRQRLLVVVHLNYGNRIRIVSARLATRHERREYEEGSS